MNRIAKSYSLFSLSLNLKVSCDFLEVLAFRHAGACLTLLCNTVDENSRGMKEWKKERMKEQAEAEVVPSSSLVKLS